MSKLPGSRSARPYPWGKTRPMDSGSTWVDSWSSVRGGTRAAPLPAAIATVGSEPADAWNACSPGDSADRDPRSLTVRATRKNTESPAPSPPSRSSIAASGRTRPPAVAPVGPLGGTRDRLIAVAADLFSKHGFGPVGLDRVISEVGVTKTTFYNHFESKDDLIIAVLDHRHSVEQAELEEDIRRKGGDCAKSQLLAIFDAMDEWFHDPDFRGCIFMNAATEFPSPSDPINQAARVHGEGLFELVRGLAEGAGLEPAQAESVAGQYMVLLTGAIAARHINRELDAAKTAKVIAAAVLAAVGQPDRSGRALAAAGPKVVGGNA